MGEFSEENEHHFLHKSMSKMIPLAMVDDLLRISKCGVDSLSINTSVNTPIELKKLEFHIPEPKKNIKMSLSAHWKTKHVLSRNESA